MCKNPNPRPWDTPDTRQSIKYHHNHTSWDNKTCPSDRLGHSKHQNHNSTMCENLNPNPNPNSNHKATPNGSPVSGQGISPVK